LRPRRLRKSLTVNAASLMAATVATNLLGLAFWAEAAHLRPAAVVGRAAAAVAALSLLGSIGQLNLTNVFLRLVPGAGERAAGLIERGYVGVVCVALLAGVVYAATGLSAHVLTGGWLPHVLFVLTVPLLAIFVLQDSVLTSLRLTPWVPVENVLFSVAKLLLLPALVLLPTGGGIVIAWVIPAGVAVAVVSGLLFARVLPGLGGVGGVLPPRRRLLSFVAAEYISNLFSTAVFQLVPLFVLWKLGSATVAYFTLPWLIWIGVTVLLWNVSSTLVVELIGEHGDPMTLLRRAVLLRTLIVVAAALGCIVAAHPLLELAGGSRYAEHGTSLLRLIGLAIPFYAVVGSYAQLLWLEQRIWLLCVFQGLAALALLLAIALLLPRVGLDAVGWANLGVQGLSALVAGGLLLRRWRRRTLLRVGDYADPRRSGGSSPMRSRDPTEAPSGRAREQVSLERSGGSGEHGG
jgi:O-antigen/teichoic acid export membrane protein